MGDLIDRLRAQNWPTSRNGALLPPRDPPAINIEAADEIAALRERVAELEGHIREQSEHVRTRIKDGIELGATVWRIALEDVSRENDAALSRPDDGGVR